MTVRLCEVATSQTEAAWLEKALVTSQDDFDRLVRRVRFGDDAEPIAPQPAEAVTSDVVTPLAIMSTGGAVE